MNTLELLYNKALMKAASSQDEHIKKGKVWYGPVVDRWDDCDIYFLRSFSGQSSILFLTNK